MASFAEIWEQDGRWLIGPGLLGDIIEHLRGRGPIALRDPFDSNQVNLQIPLPTVRDEISGDQVSIGLFVPEELLPIFNDRCSLIMRNWYDEAADRVIRSNFGIAITDQTLARFTSELANIEQGRMYQGDEPALWAIAAEAFGFSRWSPPSPAGLTQARV